MLSNEPKTFFPISRLYITTAFTFTVVGFVQGNPTQGDPAQGDRAQGLRISPKNTTALSKNASENSTALITQLGRYMKNCPSQFHYIFHKVWVPITHSQFGPYFHSNLYGQI